MTIAVTGTTGHLGRMVINDLLGRGVSASELVAPVRSLDKAADLSDLGVQVRRADYTDPATLHTAFDGVDRVVFVSGSEVGSRVPQHQNVIDAAADAGVELIAYTSIVHADNSKMVLADEHVATEKMLARSGVPHVLLRNSWYLENYTAALPMYLEHGAILGAAGEGRVSAAVRADFASAAATVVFEDGHAGSVYELGGEPAFTLAELAATVSEISGTKVEYRDLDTEALVAALSAAGVPEPMAQVLADSDLGIVRGDLFTDSGALTKLIGRPPTTMAEAVREALAG